MRRIRQIKKRMELAGIIFLALFALPVAGLALSEAATAAPEITSAHATAPAQATEELPIAFTSFEEISEAPEPATIPEPTTTPEPTATPEPESSYIYYDVPLSDEMQIYIQDLCTGYDFDRYDIIIALIGAESSYREKVVSKTNDYGYMQINQCNHEWLTEMFGPLDFTDGQDNIQCGIYILDNLCDKYGDIGLALMAYNCGERGARNLWEQGIYSTNYSRNIQQQATELALRETSSN